MNQTARVSFANLFYCYIYNIFLCAVKRLNRSYGFDTVLFIVSVFLIVNGNSFDGYLNYSCED